LEKACDRFAASLDEDSSGDPSGGNADDWLKLRRSATATAVEAAAKAWSGAWNDSLAPAAADQQLQTRAIEWAMALVKGEPDRDLAGNKTLRELPLDHQRLYLRHEPDETLRGNADLDPDRLPGDRDPGPVRGRDMNTLGLGYLPDATDAYRGWADLVADSSVELQAIDALEMGPGDLLSERLAKIRALPRLVLSFHAIFHPPEPDGVDLLVPAGHTLPGGIDWDALARTDFSISWAEDDAVMGSGTVLGYQAPLPFGEALWGIRHSLRYAPRDAGNAPYGDYVPGSAYAFDPAKPFVPACPDVGTDYDDGAGMPVSFDTGPYLVPTRLGTPAIDLADGLYLVDRRFAVQLVLTVERRRWQTVPTGTPGVDELVPLATPGDPDENPYGFELDAPDRGVESMDSWPWPDEATLLFSRPELNAVFTQLVEDTANALRRLEFFLYEHLSRENPPLARLYVNQPAGVRRIVARGEVVDTWKDEVVAFSDREYVDLPGDQVLFGDPVQPLPPPDGVGRGAPRVLRDRVLK